MKDFEIIAKARKEGITITHFDLDDWFMVFATLSQRQNYYQYRELPNDITTEIILKAKEINTKVFNKK
jgi:hypothetical protein